MRRSSDILRRATLVVPMAYETYWLARVGVRATHASWNVSSFLVGALLEVWLPALGFLIGCVLIILASSARWVWLVVTASSLWIVVILWLMTTEISVRGLWGLSAEFAIAVYTLLLSLSFLLAERGHAAEGLNPWGANTRSCLR